MAFARCVFWCCIIGCRCLFILLIKALEPTVIKPEAPLRAAAFGESPPRKRQRRFRGGLSAVFSLHGENTAWRAGCASGFIAVGLSHHGWFVSSRSVYFIAVDLFYRGWLVSSRSVSHLVAFAVDFLKTAYKNHPKSAVGFHPPTKTVISAFCVRDGIAAAKGRFLF